MCPLTSIIILYGDRDPSCKHVGYDVFLLLQKIATWSLPLVNALLDLPWVIQNKSAFDEDKHRVVLIFETSCGAVFIASRRGSSEQTSIPSY